MASAALLFELAFVGIGMARGASRKVNVGIARQPIVAVSMTFLAGCVEVRSGERVACLRMVEVLRVNFGRLPVNGRMALSAGCSKAALVLVFMAGGTTG